MFVLHLPILHIYFISSYLYFVLSSYSIFNIPLCSSCSIIKFRIPLFLLIFHSHIRHSFLCMYISMLLILCLSSIFILFIFYTLSSFVFYVSFFILYVHSPFWWSFSISMSVLCPPYYFMVILYLYTPYLLYSIFVRHIRSSILHIRCLFSIFILVVFCTPSQPSCSSSNVHKW